MGRTAADGDRSWAQGIRGACRSDVRSSDGSRGGARRRRIAKYARTQDRAKERWLFGFGSCLRTDGRAGLYRGSADRGQSPFGVGGPVRGASGRYRSIRCPTDRWLSCARPRTEMERIFTPEAQARLFRDYEVVLLGPDSTDDELDAVLPTAFAVVGQPDLPRVPPRARDRAARRHERRGQLLPQRRLRGVLPGRHPRPGLRPRVRARRSPSSRSAWPSTSRAGSAARTGPSAPAASDTSRRATTTRSCCAARTSASSATATSAAPCTRSCARSTPTIRAFDPWLPASTLRDAGLVPATLDEVLTHSRVVFVLATVTAESERLLGARELDLLPARRAARAGQPGRRVRLRRGAGAGRGRPVPGRDRRLAAGADAGGRPGPGARGPGALAAPRGRHPGGVPRDRRDGPRRPRPGPAWPAAGPDAAAPRASWWAGTAAGPSADRPRSAARVDVRERPRARAGGDRVRLRRGARRLGRERRRGVDGLGRSPAASTPDASSRRVTASPRGRRWRRSSSRATSPRRSRTSIDSSSSWPPRRARCRARASSSPPCPSARWALCTSGNRVLATARLAASGIDPPPVFVTADDVAHGKPDPEGYALAIRRLGADPADSVVIEDAPNGVVAARAAGVGTVIGVGERARRRRCRRDRRGPACRFVGRGAPVRRARGAASPLRIGVSLCSEGEYGAVLVMRREGGEPSSW